MNAAIIFAGGTGQRMKNTAKPKSENAKAAKENDD